MVLGTDPGPVFALLLEPPEPEPDGTVIVEGTVIQLTH